jgi:hypothetical protein
MKRKLFFLICILSFNFSFSQSIVSTNKLWNNIIHYYDNYWHWGTENIKFTTDTIINSLTYKKVERSLDENQQNWFSYGYIRENTNKQVFYKINAPDTERLLYDLHLQQNDSVIAYTLNTLYPWKGLQPVMYRVVNIDSTIIGQTYRKRLNLAPASDTVDDVVEMWIDSTGSMSGMLHNFGFYCGCDYYSLLCFTENGILKYHDSNYSSCYILTGINESVVKPTIIIYPNPMMDVPTLEINNFNEYISISISLYNLSGNEVLKSTDQKLIKIYKNNLPSGIYFYRITSNNIKLETGKIIIN